MSKNNRQVFRNNFHGSLANVPSPYCSMCRSSKPIKLFYNGNILIIKNAKILMTLEQSINVYRVL